MRSISRNLDVPMFVVTTRFCLRLLCRRADPAYVDSPFSFVCWTQIPYIVRFGPGRLTRRHHQTERLRELRTRRCAGPTHDADITPLPLSKGPVVVQNRAEAQRVCDDAMAASNTVTSNKRRRGPTGGARHLLRQRFSDNASAELALASTPLADATSAPMSEQPRASGEEASAHDCEDRGRNESGLIARTCSSGGRVFTNQDGVGRIIHLNTGRLLSSISPSEGTNVGLGGTRRIPAPRSASSVAPHVILPVRSAPASRRPRGARTAVGMSRSMTDTQQGRIAVQQCDRRSGKQRDGDGDAGENSDNGITGFSGGEDEEYYDTLSGSDGAPAATCGSSSNKSGSGYPGIADACGGIVLRLSPAERSLEPWSSVVSPLRAMCDIEPSLSRAGLECREVINAVEAAQEMKSQDQAKVRKTKRGTHNDPRRLTESFIVRVYGVLS